MIYKLLHKEIPSKLLSIVEYLKDQLILKDYKEIFHIANNKEDITRLRDLILKQVKIFILQRSNHTNIDKKALSNNK